MPRRFGTIIGIDPDVKESGVAALDCATRELELHSMSFPEAGYLNKPHWHLSPYDRPAVAAAKGNSVGRNQQVALDLVACLDYYGIPYDTIKPLVKMWNGPDRKITHEELVYFTGLKDRTSNPEKRDAALLAWGYADFPFGRIPNRGR